MDHTVDALRWITAAEAEVCDVGGTLNALSAASTESTGGACPTAEGLGIHGLANLDAAGVAARLKHLAERLQTVVTNLIHLAVHADLSRVVESLKVPTTPAAPETIPDVASISGSYKSESDVEFDRLLAELEEPMSHSTPEMETRPQSDHTD